MFRIALELSNSNARLITRLRSLVEKLTAIKKMTQSQNLATLTKKSLKFEYLLLVESERGSNPGAEILNYAPLSRRELSTAVQKLTVIFSFRHNCFILLASFFQLRRCLRFWDLQM